MSSQRNQKKKNNTSEQIKPAPKKGAPRQKGISNWIWLSAILVLTLIVFVPALNNAFTNWDDPHYLNDNLLIRKFNAENIRRIFTEVYFGNYQPLHIFSYALEYQFYKLDPAGYHTTSVIMHLVVTALVFRFIFLISESSAIALLAALLFGVHPLHVESVAWAAERKDLLYAMFFLASLIFYIQYIKNEQKMKYLFFAFLLFTLSILSKAMATSLPPVLILMDYYFTRKFNTKIVLEKIPFFALAVVFGLISVYTVSSTGQVSLDVFTLFERIIIANYNLLVYAFKLIFPVQLSAFYPYPEKVNGLLPYYFYIAPFAVAGFLVLVIRSLKWTKVIFFGTGFFLACVILVLQLFPVGSTIISERYSYLPSVGFFFIAAWSIHTQIQKHKKAKTFIYILLTGYILFLSVSTYNRCFVWKDSISLWTDVLEQFPHEGTALNNRGNSYGRDKGNLIQAMADFNASIKYNPKYYNAYVNRGIVYCMNGKFDLGLNDFNKAIELKPTDFDALYNRAITFSKINKPDSAVKDLNLLATLSPDDSRIYFNRGLIYLYNGKNESALDDFNKVLSIDPNMAETYYRRSNAFYNLRQYKNASQDASTAISRGFSVGADYMQALKRAEAGN